MNTTPEQLDLFEDEEQTTPMDAQKVAACIAAGIPPIHMSWQESVRTLLKGIGIVTCITFSVFASAVLIQYALLIGWGGA